MLIRDLPTFVSETNQTSRKYKDEYPIQVDDSSDDEENYAIKPSDCVLLAAKIEEEGSSLEVYVYEEAKFNLYVHHEVILSAYPVALEWLYCDFNRGEGGAFPRANIAVVGLMNSAIELWNLDVLDDVEPTAVVGGKQAHTDSITNLALHPSRPNVLVSASADKTMKFWDLQTNKLLTDFKSVGEEIQNVMWDSKDEAVLYAYGPQNILRIFDARGPKEVAKVKLGFGVENFCQSPKAPEKLFVSSEEGVIKAVDLNTRKLIAGVDVKAHEKAATSIACNKAGHLVSNGLDGWVHVWDVKTFQKLASQQTDLENLYGSSMHPDSDHLFACGSSKGEVMVWDFTHDINGEKK